MFAHNTIFGKESTMTRTSFLQKSLQVAAVNLLVSTQIPIVKAETSETSAKQYNLSPDKIASIVKSDVVERAFLSNGNLTRSIYAESATFTDEIDTYKLDQWMKGTQRLFVGPPGSYVNLVGNIEATEKEVSFQFEEDLMFRIPFRPVVHLTGKVVLERDIDTGLITSYREFWDQDVVSVLKTAKFS